MPALGAVIEASIFIASMVATTCARVDRVALLDLEGDHAVEGRRHLAVVLAGRPSPAPRPSDSTDSSRTLIGRNWPLIVAITRAVAALVGLADRL